MLNRDFDLSLCCCSWRDLEGMYSIALVLVAPSPDLAGLGKAIEAGGTSLSVVALGRESLLVVGKMELPGSGVGARLALTGATLVRRTLEFLLRVACLELLTPGMPAVVGRIPGVGEVYVRARAMLRDGAEPDMGGPAG